MISKETANIIFGERLRRQASRQKRGVKRNLKTNASGRSENRHFHTKARQFFFVLSGKATIEINGKRKFLK